jgi:hypothetical protein
MRAGILALATTTALLAGCQGSSKVTVGAYTLVPKDGVFWSGTVDRVPTTNVVIADQDGLCGRYKALNECSAAAQTATPGDGMFLTISVTGQTPGDYTVGSTDPTRRADLAFMVRSGDAVTFSDRSISGMVSFTSLTPGNGGGGHYEVTLKSGEQITGTFESGYCGDLDDLVQREAVAALSCATNFTTTTCTHACTCTPASGPRSASADCTRPDSSSDWSCTCVRDGESSPCTVAKTDGNVCTQGNGCCDTSF